jgi:hypothetical protein
MRKSLILVALALVSLTAFGQDFSYPTFEWYGDPCLTQPDQFSTQYGIRYNSGGWTYAGLNPSCGTVPVPQKILNKDSYKADTIWLAQFGTTAPASVHNQINNGPLIDFGQSIDSVWASAKSNMVGCVGSGALNARMPSYVKIQKTIWQDGPGIFPAGQTFQDGTIWAVNFYLSNGNGQIWYAVNSNSPLAGGGTLLEWEFDNWIYYVVTGSFQEAPCHPGFRPEKRLPRDG